VRSWFVAKLHEVVLSISKEQVRMVAAEFATACRSAAAFALAGHVAALLGVAVLRAALVKLRPSVNHLTPVHGEFVKLCVAAHAHHRALPIIADSLFNVDGDADVAIEDVLTYAYYAGLAYTGARRFVDARLMFHRCMQTPATAVSAIAVEAYKKYVLVSLIIDGKVAPSALSDLPQALTVALPRVAEAYHELAQASTKSNSISGNSSSSNNSAAPSRSAKAASDEAGGKKRRGDEPLAGMLSPGEAAALLQTSTPRAGASKLERVAVRHVERVRADRNLGLLKQALAAERRVDLKRQTKTYLTLSLAAIAQRAGLANEAAAEELLLQMIEAGEIFAKISARDGMVVFQDVSESYRGPAQLKHINELIDNVIRLGRNIRDLEHEFKLDPAAIKKTLMAANNDAQFGAMMALDD
jgi:COP9 signalosome complex subunit 3